MPPSQQGGIPKRIGLDCRLSGHRHAGIGRYILNLAQRLPSTAPDLQFVYFFEHPDQKKEIDPTNSLNIEWVEANFSHYSFAEQWQFPRLLSLAKVDVLHVPHFNAPILYFGKLVVTIHDLLWHEYKGTSVTTLPFWSYWIKYVVYKLVVALTIGKAQQILVPSQAVATTVTKYYPSAKSKMTVTYEGISTDLIHNHSSRYNPKQLLYIGSLYPHKNLELVFQALKKMPDYQLILVGARDAFSSRIQALAQQLKISNQISLLGFVPDARLKELISGSLAVIQPSLSEGFGLTGLEAMGAGGVVIASDIPVFHEIYGSAAAYFNPRDAEDFRQVVAQISPQKRIALKKEAQQQVKKYDWQQMTKETVACYQTVLSL